MTNRAQPQDDYRRGYAALWALSLIVMAASATAFAESYNGLRKWAEQHRVTGMWADIWPLQVDAFIAAGELTLLLSALYLWPMRVRILAWTVSLVGLGVSIICNAGHVGTLASISDHLTAALPPVAAIAGLVIALSVMKQISHMTSHPDPRQPMTEPVAATVAAWESVNGVDLTFTPTAPANTAPARQAAPSAEVADAGETVSEAKDAAVSQSAGTDYGSAESVREERPQQRQIEDAESVNEEKGGEKIGEDAEPPPTDVLLRRYEELLGGT
jgi:hypothetical protein